MFGETTFSVLTRFENGVASVKVMASTPYGRRSCQVSEDVTDEKILAKIAAASEAAIKAAEASLRQTAAKETARAVVAAANNREEI